MAEKADDTADRNDALDALIDDTDALEADDVEEDDDDDCANAASGIAHAMVVLRRMDLVFIIRKGGEILRCLK